MLLILNVAISLVSLVVTFLVFWVSGVMVILTLNHTNLWIDINIKMALMNRVIRTYSVSFSRPSQIIPEKVIGFDLGTYEKFYTRSLYAASMGSSANPVARQDRYLTWERNRNFNVLPTFGVTIGNIGTLQRLAECPDMPEFSLNS